MPCRRQRASGRTCYPDLFVESRLALEGMGQAGRPLQSAAGVRPQRETKGEVTGREPDQTKGEIMGTVFKKTATKPLPAGAKIIVRKGQRLAEWIDAKGKRRTAPVTVGKDGTDRLVDHRPDLHREVSGRLGDHSGNGHGLPG